MANETIEELKSAFEKWRSEKQRRAELIPDELLERARRLIPAYGPTLVARTLRMNSQRLKDPSFITKARKQRARTSVKKQRPTYTRLELLNPRKAEPFAEIETPSGAQLRFYIQNQDILGLLSAVITGGVR